MAIKKSQLYGAIWKACDALRGGMDASEYKDYVLTLLFVRYVSDKYAGKTDVIVEIPTGGSFADMVALKGKTNIGEGIDTILSKLAESNALKGVIDRVSFNDEDKLGKGKEMVDRLTSLIAIFENPDLDFSKNKADGDDLLGDAYEYLIGHFAVESGKSKGNFYTPAEVSRIMAKVIGADKSTSRQDTVYDPTCGSGSLLLKVADEAPKITIYGQEKDNTTKSLALLNMWMHGKSIADIKGGQSTLSNPLFLNNEGNLLTFDFVVANPPFSDKKWTNGFKPSEDQFERFTGYGIPPEKNGDYAFLLHILKSMKSRRGMGAVILPHGVLVRGNTEANIRKNIIKYVRGIIGLPANLFYGTGIPACIIVLDKSKADEHKGIFMIDASNGYTKDGNKSRLREQDIKKIIDTFLNATETPHYSRFVPNSEIERNDFNLNIPRYIEKQNDEIIQNIDGHLNGGIPNADVDALIKYWEVCPSLKDVLFGAKRDGFSELKISVDNICAAISDNVEFNAFSAKVQQTFNEYAAQTATTLGNIKVGSKPKEIIAGISADLLNRFADIKLLDKYDIYGILLNYWNETMQDDVYVISVDGWSAGNSVARGQKESKKGKTDIAGVEGLDGTLIPVPLLINIYFSDTATQLNAAKQALETTQREMEQLLEEHSGDDGAMNEALNDKGNVDRKKFSAALKAASGEDLTILKQYDSLVTTESKHKKQIKDIETKLEALVLVQYPKLTQDEIKDIVINKKWLASIGGTVAELIGKQSSDLAAIVKQIVDRYDRTLSNIESNVSMLESRVAEHMKQVGVTRELLTGRSQLPGFSKPWVEVRLGDICKYQNGKSLEQYFSEVGKYEVISIGNYSEEGKFVKTNCFIDDKYLDNVQQFILNANDLAMILNDKTSAGNIIGKTLLIEKSNSYVFNQRTMRLIPNKGIDSRFLHFLINSDYVHSEIYKKAKLGTQIYVNTNDVLDLKLKIPDNELEQIAIVEVLSDMDALIESVGNLLSKNQAIRLGIKQALLTDKIL